MPVYEYRCQDCRNAFGIERSMNDPTLPACEKCGGKNVNRIWNAFIRTGGVTPDVGQGTNTAKKTSNGGCGSCSSHSCGTCH